MCKIKIEIIKIKQLIESGKIRWTHHAIVRLLQRKIMQDDVISALKDGEIIEEYENDYPNPSCLIYGISLRNEILHIVCNYSEEELWIITAYHPDNTEWDSDMKKRKENK